MRAIGVELASASGPRSPVRSSARVAPGRSRPSVSTRSPTRASKRSTTSSAEGPSQGYCAYQYATTSLTYMPLVERPIASRIGTPSEPKISTSALCQSTSESSSSPSMSNNVARKLTALPLHTRNYGEEVIVRRLESRDIDQVVARVNERL